MASERNHIRQTDDKVDLIDRLSNCGFAKIEATSFTSPRAIPALRDAEAVMHRIRRHPGVVYTVLVPNVRGVERAMSCGVDEVNLVMSASETHNRANLRMTREQSFAQLTDVIAAVKEWGRDGDQCPCRPFSVARWKGYR
jgi:hydroxymethylglutaryl-CoA lyase